MAAVAVMVALRWLGRVSVGSIHRLGDAGRPRYGCGQLPAPYVHTAPEARQLLERFEFLTRSKEGAALLCPAPCVCCTSLSARLPAPPRPFWQLWLSLGFLI